MKLLGRLRRVKSLVGVNEGRTDDIVEEKRIKRQEDVLWFKILDRFGLPTLFAIVLLAFVLRIGDKLLSQMDAERKANNIVLNGFVTAVNQNTQVLQRVSDTLTVQGAAIHDLSDRQIAIEKKLGISRPTYDKSRENVNESGSR